VFEITLLVVVLGSTLTGFYWVMTRYLAVPSAGALLILSPVALLVGLTAIYSYYLGLVRYRRGAKIAAVNRFGKSSGEIVVLVTFVLLQTLAMIYLTAKRNLALAVLLAFTACVTVVWGLTRIQRGGPLVIVGKDVQSDPQWRVFERRFRIFVFGLLLILPSGLALFSLLALQDLPVTALFAFIAAVIAPWVIRRIRAEVQSAR